MSNPYKQHFLPESYIQNFSFNSEGDVYGLKIKSPYPNKRIKTWNKSQICYKPHIYTIKSNDKIDDKYFIEKEKFDYENSFLKAITSKIENKVKITFEEKRELVKMILSIKHRNKKMYDLFKSEKNIQGMVRASTDQINSWMPKNTDKDSEDKILKFKNYIIEKIEDDARNPDKISDMANLSMVQFVDENNPHFSSIIDSLLLKKFIVLHAAQGWPFISSDNPGFTVHHGSRISDMHFGSADYFFFPISTSSTLIIDVKQKDSHKMDSRLEHQMVDSKRVNQINEATIENCIELIFSNKREVLSRFVI